MSNTILEALAGRKKGAIREAEHKVECFPVKPDPVLPENHSVVVSVKP
jgi:hypothetical protein